MSKKVIFLTLKVFSSTGGIEKVCRVAGKALYEFGLRRNADVRFLSMYDKANSADHNKYFPSEIFKGFGINKKQFIIHSVKEGRNADVIILSHINLLIVGWLIKKIKPTVKIILFAHGIEVWGKKSVMKRKMLQSCDEIIAVSEFTKRKMISENGIHESACSVINNCLDPFLILPRNVVIPADLPQRYGIIAGDKILFTLSRLSSTERYKGYDKVMEAMVNLTAHVKYIIGGSYDQEEKEYIENIITKLHLGNRVILAGFIPDDEVEAHFTMSDCYVMPSIKEGFGIVFVEAMFYNLPVIAGNQDGSTDALRNGELGLLVNPSQVDEIRKGIIDILGNPSTFKVSKRTLLHYFSYASYKLKISNLLLKHLGMTDRILENYLKSDYFHAV